MTQQNATTQQLEDETLNLSNENLVQPKIDEVLDTSTQVSKKKAKSVISSAPATDSTQPKNRRRREDSNSNVPVALSRSQSKASLLEAGDDPSEINADSCSSSEFDERELNLRPNIKHVVYCNFKFNAWFRSPRYFDESAPSGVTHCSPSLHLNRLQVKTEYNKEIETVRNARKAKRGDHQAESVPSSEPLNYANSDSKTTSSVNSTTNDTTNIEADTISTSIPNSTEEPKRAIPKGDAEDEGLIDTLYICDTCFRYTSEAKEMAIHIPKCPYRAQLPGRVVYDSPYYQIRKIDGARHLLYTQCLSLFAKLFLDHKSICYALETFDFYVLTTSVANIQGVNQFALSKEIEVVEGTQPTNDSHKRRESGAHFSGNNSKPLASGNGKRALPRNNEQPTALVPTELSSPLSSQRVIGFFSKEKVSWDNYNLACITIFPPFQKRGLGKLLIEYSYFLSRKSKVIGTPERPLSPEGFLAYIKYWSNTIALYISRRFVEHEANLEIGSNVIHEGDDNTLKPDSEIPKDTKGRLSLSINEISKATYIKADDVLKALEYMGVLIRVPKSLDGSPDFSVTIPIKVEPESDTPSVTSVDPTEHQNLLPVLDMDVVSTWVQDLRVKSSIVPLFEEYCIVRRRINLPADQGEKRMGEKKHTAHDEEIEGEEEDEEDDYDSEEEVKKRKKRRRSIKR